MAVIGSGTSADPYVVNNWTDFCSVKDTAGCYIFWEDTAESNKIVDLNEEVPNGYSSQFTIDARQVDFNGWTIKNLTVDASRGDHISRKVAVSVARSQGTKLMNGKFLNCYFTCSFPLGANGYSSRWGELFDCVVTGMWHSTVNGSDSSVSDSYISMTRCAVSFNVLQDPGGYDYWTHLMNYCVARFNIQSEKTGGIFITFQNSYNSAHDSKYVINLKGGNAVSTDIGIIFHGGNNDVFIVDSDVKSVYGYGTESSPFDTGSVSPVYTTNANDVFNQSWFVQVTQSQMQDADYLLSIGFPIATGVGS